jgi:hypothetical protein
MGLILLKDSRSARGFAANDRVNVAIVGGALAEFVLLGNVTTLVGKPIEYDPIAGQVVNLAEANAALKREYREGWAL